MKQRQPPRHFFRSIDEHSLQLNVRLEAFKAVKTKGTIVHTAIMTVSPRQ